MGADKVEEYLDDAMLIHMTMGMDDFESGLAVLRARLLRDSRSADEWIVSADRAFVRFDAFDGNTVERIVKILECHSSAIAMLRSYATRHSLDAISPRLVAHVLRHFGPAAERPFDAVTARAIDFVTQEHHWAVLVMVPTLLDDAATLLDVLCGLPRRTAIPEAACRVIADSIACHWSYLVRHVKLLVLYRADSLVCGKERAIERLMVKSSLRALTGVSSVFWHIARDRSANEHLLICLNARLMFDPCTITESLAKFMSVLVARVIGAGADAAFCLDQCVVPLDLMPDLLSQAVHHGGIEPALRLCSTTQRDVHDYARYPVWDDPNERFVNDVRMRRLACLTRGDDVSVGMRRWRRAFVVLLAQRCATLVRRFVDAAEFDDFDTTLHAQIVKCLFRMLYSMLNDSVWPSDAVFTDAVHWEHERKRLCRTERGLLWLRQHNTARKRSILIARGRRSDGRLPAKRRRVSP